MSADLICAVAAFVRDAHDELPALSPLSTPALCTALREASFSIGNLAGNGRIGGAVISSGDGNDAGSPKGLAMLAAMQARQSKMDCSNSLFRRVFAILTDNVKSQNALGMPS